MTVAMRELLAAHGFHLQVGSLFAAFWVAVLFHRFARPDGEGAVRFVLGLAAGAVAAHAGWLLLHPDRLAGLAGDVFDPAVGSSLLFVPAGLLLVTPWRATARERERFLAAAFGALPLAFATARLGCLAVGCCHGTASSLPWALPQPVGPSLHPAAAYEIFGWLAIYAAIQRLPAGQTAPAVLVGMGVLRLALDPFRAPPAHGEAAIPFWAVAACWVFVGGVLSSLQKDGRAPARARSGSGAMTADRGRVVFRRVEGRE